MSSTRFPVLRARSLSLFTSAVSVLLVAIAPLPAHAQSSTLSPVVITGSREPTPLDRLVGDIVVIDAERIRSSSADTLEDLLRREGGIQLSRTGGPGQPAGLFLRGSAASSTLVLVDGVRIGSATLGQVDFAALGLGQIERIEILRGPASSLYGPDAVGGVVQIITRRGTGPLQFGAHAAAGELGSSLVEATLGGAGGPFDYAASLSHEASRGVSAIKPNDTFGNFNPDRDGFARTNVALRGGYSLAQGHRIGISMVEDRLNSQYDSAEFLPPNFNADPTPDFRNHVTTRGTALDYRGVLSPAWTTTVQLSGQTEDLLSGATEQFRFRTRREQLTWQNAWRPAEGQQLVGVIEALHEKVEATGYLSSPSRHNTAAMLGYTGAFGALKVQADGRHDRNSVYGDVDTGKLGVAYDLQQGLTLRAVAGTAFRAPAFNDLFYPGYGVTTVGPERSTSVEVGVQWKSNASSAGATLYRNRVRDLIAYEPDRSFCPADPSYDFGCARNINRATLQGATLTAAHRLGAFALRATIDFLDAKDDATGQRLVRRAAHQETLGADWARGPWTAGAALLRVGARPEGGSTLPAYQIVDLQTRYRLNAHWQIEARLLNAFDKRYEPVRDFQALGRQGWVGVRYAGAGL